MTNTTTAQQIFDAYRPGTSTVTVDAQSIDAGGAWAPDADDLDEVGGTYTFPDGSALYMRTGDTWGTVRVVSAGGDVDPDDDETEEDERDRLAAEHGLVLVRHSFTVGFRALRGDLEVFSGTHAQILSWLRSLRSRGGISTNQALEVLGLRKELQRSADICSGARIYSGEKLLFKGTLYEVNAWLRMQPGCPEGF